MSDNESLEGAKVVPEGFLEEVRLRHLASAYLGATFEPQSQLWAAFLKCSLSWRTLLYPSKPGSAIISSFNSPS